MRRVVCLCLWSAVVALVGGCGGLSQSPLQSPKWSGTAGVSPAQHRSPDADEVSNDVVTAHARYAAAVIADLNGETEKALDEFYQAAWDDPSNEWLILEVSRRLMAARQYERAALLLDRAAAQPNVSANVLARLSMVYSQLGKAEESEAAGRAAIRKSPATLAAYQSLFVNYMQAKEQEKALEVLDTAAKAPKPTPQFLMGLFELYVTYGVQVPEEKEAVNAKALALLNRAQKFDIKDLSLKLKLADGFSLLGQQEAATGIYQELLGNPWGLAALKENIHTKLANIYLRSSNREKAAEQLKALIKADPTNPQPYFFLGHLAFEDQKVDEAADYFSKTVLLSPDFEQAYYQLANAQLALDKPTDALATLETARAKFGASFSTEFFSAVAATRLKDYDAALRHFTAAEVIAKTDNPKRLNHLFYFQLGVACEQKKDYDQAASAFEKSLELDPNFTEAMNYLGYMWADLGTNLDKSVALLEKAVKAEPKNAAFLDSLGWAYFKQGRQQEALELVTRAVDLIEEPDPVLLEHLGDIYAARGQKEQAHEAWSKSLKLEPKDSVKAKLDAAGPP